MKSGRGDRGKKGRFPEGARARRGCWGSEVGRESTFHGGLKGSLVKKDRGMGAELWVL